MNLQVLPKNHPWKACIKNTGIYHLIMIYKNTLK